MLNKMDEVEQLYKTQNRKTSLKQTIERLTVSFLNNYLNKIVCSECGRLL